MDTAAHCFKMGLAVGGDKQRAGTPFLLRIGVPRCACHTLRNNQIQQMR
jgi:hypothetical protein